MTTTTPQRIGGWLLGRLAWLLVALEYDAGVVAVYRCVIFSANISNARRTSTDDTNLMGRFFLLPLSPCGITLWLTIAFFKRWRCVPKHYIIWLLISVLLAVKAFAFSPVEDGIAVRQLLFTLLATALIVPYFKR
ncbi:DUF2569 family protein [Shigella boydii]